MISKFKGKYSLKECLKRSKKYNSRQELWRHESGLYSWVQRNYGVKAFDKILPRQKKQRTKSDAIKELSKIKTWREVKKNKGLYEFMRRNKMLNHPVSRKLNTYKKNLNNKMKQFMKEVNKSTYVDEICFSGGKWQTFIRWRKLKPFLLKKLIDRGHPLSWSKKMVKKELRKYQGNIYRLKKERHALYEKALVYELVSGKRRGKNVLSPKEILRLSKKCKNKQEFIVRYKSAYNYVVKNKIDLNLPDQTKTTSIGEKRLRFFMETVFNSPFPKKRPEFMKNPHSKRKLELDGYSEKLKIAFEHQGGQHYEETDFFYKRSKPGTFLRCQRNDKTKLDLCSDHGVVLIQIPDVFHILKSDENKVKSLIKAELKNKGVKIPERFDKVKFF